ncbi:MAG: DUF2093 domain-containing protein [Pseudomonadota bacterium]
MLMSRKDTAAKLYYGASSFRVLRPGQHVVCAVSGAIIPLEELRYWSAEHQEAYATCEIATKRLLET